MNLPSLPSCEFTVSLVYQRMKRLKEGYPKPLIWRILIAFQWWIPRAKTQSITMTIEFPVQWYSKHRPSGISGLRIISSITFKWNCRPNDMFSNKQSFPSGKISAAFDTAPVLTSAQLYFITFTKFCSTKFGSTVVSWTRILHRTSILISDRSLKRDSNALPTPGSTWSSQPIKMEATVSKCYSINPKVINFYSKMVRGIALSCVCIQIIFPV